MLYATHARVHLDHIVANLQAVKARVGDRAVLLAIKANAYGHGAVPVAQAVERAGAADWFGVATVPEGIELRQAGIRLPILKLSQVFEDELPEAVRAGLVLTVVDEATVLAAERVAAAQGVTAEVHVKVDTGMRRIGVEPDRAAGLARLAEDQPHLVVDRHLHPSPRQRRAGAGRVHREPARDVRAGGGPRSPRRSAAASRTSTPPTPAVCSPIRTRGARWCGPASWRTATTPIRPRRAPSTCCPA